MSDHHDVTVLSQHQPAPIVSTSRGLDALLPKLSGRARAILKTYFEETNAFRFLPGQTAVVFTESQVYHLLRVLTDETLRMSHTTMERMILDAVRGSPTTAPSRTCHFKSGTRAQTPFRYVESDSSDAETGDLPTVDSEQNTTDQGELGDPPRLERATVPVKWLRSQPPSKPRSGKQAFKLFRLQFNQKLYCQEVRKLNEAVRMLPYPK